MVLTAGAGQVPAGIYAYAPVQHALVPVRLGPAAASEAIAASGAARRHDPVVVLTASYWRSAWKYGQRALRYCALDAGHAAASIAAAAQGLEARAEVVAPADPARLGALLGLEPAAAGVMTTVALELLGEPRATSGGHAEALVRPAVGGEPVSEVLLAAALELAEARGGTAPPHPPPLPEGEAVELPSVVPRDETPLADAVVRRRSIRRFSRQPIALSDLSVLLGAASCGARGPLSCAVSIRAVEGLEPGIYRYDPEGHRLVVVRLGRVAEELAAAALGQSFVGQAAACLMPLADLDATVAAGGPRAYLDAFVDAGVGGQRLYLAAAALGLGCCAAGEVVDEEIDLLACLDGDLRSVLMLYAVGLPRDL